MSDKFYLFPLDINNSGYEFLSYFECCCSLGIKPSIKKFLRYQELWGEVSIHNEKAENNQK